jgi:uncharacterized protein YkwD
MSRVVLPILVSVVIAGASLAGCSMGSVPLSSGLAQNSAAPKVKTKLVDGENRDALGGEPAARSKATQGQRTASADDRAPNGQYEKAPAGALADRDYGATKLDSEHARDVINKYRQASGLKPLKLNASLTEAAKNHSRDLAKWDRISHYGSDGSNPWDRVKRSGYNAKVAAENVGTGQATIDEVLKGWKESPGHNKNLLLGDVEHMGIALVQDPKTEFKTFWTLVIGAAN